MTDRASSTLKHVLVLGAAGQIAGHVVREFGSDKDIAMTLLARNVSRIVNVPRSSEVIQASVLNRKNLKAVLKGQEFVYANLTGDDIDLQAVAVVSTMKTAGVGRLLFVAALGIYDEVPGAFGEWNRREIGQYLPAFRRAADVIESSELDYTILRPAWLTDKDEVDYEITEKGTPFRGTEVSRKSVAALIVKIIHSPILYSRGNIGVNKPGTDGDKPAFY